MSENTIYEIASASMRKCIQTYLALAKSTSGFSNVREADFDDPIGKVILLAGKGADTKIHGSGNALLEWSRREALPFDVEAGVSFGVYADARKRGDGLFSLADKITNGFTTFPADEIAKHPYLLPIWQHLSGVFSKAALKKKIGSVSDANVSRPAAKRIAEMLSAAVNPASVNKSDILLRLESTLEGIVRDLVGRLLLESIVDSSLREHELEFMREDEYEALGGVIYDFRADFVLPNPKDAKAFIEVRKSSSRHASLYAKDKMFSAINFKGKKKDLLGVIVVDGEWTGETLRAMANIFDYVIPISKVDELSRTLKAYLEGDETKLKWLVTFKIEPNVT
jgi:hypothetical protein